MTPLVMRTHAAWKIVFILLGVAAPSHIHACNLPSELSRVVTKVPSADSLLLDDGSEVVLIGAMPPVSLDQSDANQTAWPPAEATRKHLEALVSGKAVDLAFAGRRLDRYGRQLAHVFLTQSVVLNQTHSRHWVQGDLLANGLARAYTLPGNAACLDDLITLENRARANEAGHWGSGVFQDRNAHDPRELAHYRDTFQTIEGRIDHTAKVRGQQVFDFTQSGSYRFSVWIAPPAGTSRNSSAITPESIAGKRVRVRGWIELRRNPRLTIASIRHIEILDEPLQTSDPEKATSNDHPSPIPATHQQ